MKTEAAEFRAVVEQHQRMVFSLALRVTGEYGTAEEVAQDVFLELFRSADRVAVVLRYQEDMMPDEIAAMLGQPVATVKSNLQRGLKLLRRKAEITMKDHCVGRGRTSRVKANDGGLQ
jgi:DNA-directed RNA polymerase specialized sigma24 family protein